MATESFAILSASARVITPLLTSRSRVVLSCALTAAAVPIKRTADRIVFVSFLFILCVASKTALCDLRRGTFCHSVVRI